MFYILNGYTRLIILAALIIGGIVAVAASSLGKGADVALLAACVAGGLCDLVIRIRNAYGELAISLISHRRGGHVWFIPVWIIASEGCIGYASNLQNGH